MRLGMVHSRIRMDEKMLLEAASRRGVELVPLDDREMVLDVHEPPRLDVDGVLLRSLSFYRTLATSQWLASHGVPVVNTPDVIQACGDKMETSLRLARAGVPTPRTLVAFEEETVLQALERVGYPAVLKPAVGSWGRLLAKVENPEQARAIVEHKTTLGGPQHGVLYVQEYVEKPGRDLRVFVVGEDVVAAIYRTNDQHWITNTALGGRVENCPVTPELEEVSLRAANAVGGGLLALDFMEGPDGLTCHEVNHAMEFKNSVAPTNVDIPGRMLEHVLEVAKGGV